MELGEVIFPAKMKEERRARIIAERAAAKDKRDKRAAEKKEKAYIQELLNEPLQKPVKRMVINVEWKKSKMWGNCPSLEAAIEFQDGSFTRTDKKYYASGCGYDKACAVVDELFNDYMKWRLHQISFDQEYNMTSYYAPNPTNEVRVPYGLYHRDQTINEVIYPHFSFNAGGVSSYKQICEFLGGTWECFTSGKAFDFYTFEMKE